MSFVFGFMLGIPAGIYFGEKGLNFPIQYIRSPTKEQFGYVKIDLDWIRAINEDFRVRIVIK